jgi:hypothetical protein
MEQPGAGGLESGRSFCHPETARRGVDASDANFIRVFGENPRIPTHPQGWTRGDAVDALDVRLLSS